MTGVDHLGLQVDDKGELQELRERLRSAGMSVFDEGETVCCSARSDKSWAEDPSGIAWEAYKTMKNVLVLCTGNSCRSVTAEALINQMGEGRFKAVSAGSFPAGYVHPKAIETLKRHGINAGDPRSKSWDEFENQSFDLVITVCDQAASESCPIFLGKYEKKHWSTPDPAKAEGTEEEIEKAFDDAFQMLKDRIEKELL